MRRAVHRAVGPGMILATILLVLWAFLGGQTDPALLEGADSSEADWAFLQWIYHVIGVVFVWLLTIGALIILGALTGERSD
ncbi:hypothetical protein BH23CHL8_BH23CHL8_01730 [soil metagenome]